MHRLLLLRRSVVTMTSDIMQRYAKPTGPVDTYHALVQHNLLQNDPQQIKSIGLLQDLHDRIVAYAPEIDPPGLASAVAGASSAKPSGGLFSKFFATKAPAVKHGPKGLYLWGGVGCGKTTLMDLFYACSSVERKKRIHFHEFMLGVHSRIHRLRMKTPGGFTGDPIPLVVAEMMRESWLYCFDEMQCSDIADAMILRRLFEGLMSHGAVVVATSNRIPDDLYKNGLQREFFVPFIHLIHERCTVHHLASKTDYRLTGHMASKTYMSPINDQTVAAADELFRQLTHNEPLSDATLNISGRSLRVPECARGVARFTFDELCRRPLGASDYLTLAAHFHTVFIVGVPRMTLANRTEARRLILLIDALYDHRCKTVFVAEDVPALLFRGKPRDRIDEMNKDAAEMMDEMDPTKAADASKASVFTGEDEVFAFDRCVSRMMEMQSTEYLESMHKTTTELIAS